MKGYKDLIVWQKSMDFVCQVYQLTNSFPRQELYALTSQMTRAAVSIPANIAEGYSRKGRKEYVQFLHIAYGSLAEVETYLELSIRLGYGSEKKLACLNDLREEIGKMLYTIIKKLDN